MLRPKVKTRAAQHLVLYMFHVKPTESHRLPQLTVIEL
jgi:hypothetical protein